MFCPYYKNKEVFDGFNEMVEAFGGEPMTEEEFRSAELRNQRTGRNFSAMEAAYRLYDRNGGNFLDHSPNGKPSILFQQLLDYFDGDRVKAIIKKSDVYSDKYIQQFGNWLSEGFESENIDRNGEPLFITKRPEAVKKEKPIQKESSFAEKMLLLKAKFNPFSDNSFGVGGVNMKIGKVSTSNLILQSMIEQHMVSNINEQLANVLLKHEIPTLYKELPPGVTMTTVTDDRGGSIIYIDYQKIKNLSNQYVANDLLHEIIHAITVPAIKSPRSEQERRFSRLNKRLFSYFDKLLPASKYSRSDYYSGYYILNSEEDFAAEFAMNPQAKRLLYEAAYMEEAKKFSGVFGEIKKYINAFTKLVVNRNVFNVPTEQLKKYELVLRKYITMQKPITIENISREDVYNALLDAISPEQLSLDLYMNQSKVFNFYYNTFNKNNILLITPSSTSAMSAVNKIKRSFEDVASMLEQRVAAIKASSLPQKDKVQLSSIVQSQIQYFRSDDQYSYNTVLEFAQQTLYQLENDLSYIRNINTANGTIDHSTYQYMRHSNFGVYEKILQNLQRLLEDRSILDDMINKIVSEEIRNNTEQFVIAYSEAVNELNKTISQALKYATEGIGLSEIILTRNIKELFTEKALEWHSQSVMDYLSDLKEIGYDTSKWFSTGGAVDGARDTALRVLVRLVNEANRKAQKNTNKIATKLLELADKLQPGESMLDLYETVDGLNTGYLVRDLNIGKFWQDYNNFLKELNVSLGLDPKNRIAPEDEELRKQWVERRVTWVSKHANMRFLPEYYIAYGKLSPLAQKRRRELTSAMLAIKSKYLTEDGYYDFTDMTPEEWKEYNGLKIEMNILASDYDENGTLKTGEELKIAKEIQELNSVLYSKPKQVSGNAVLWKRALDKYKRSLSGLSPEEFNKAVSKWHERHSIQRLKVDDEGNSLLFKTINDEFKRKFGFDYHDLTYEYNGDGGARYNEIQNEIKEIRRRYKSKNELGYDTTQMSPSVKRRLTELYEERDRIKIAAKRTNNDLKIYSQAYFEIFNKYAVIKESKAFKEERSEYYSNLPFDESSSFDTQMLDMYMEQFYASTGSIIGVFYNTNVYRAYDMYTVVEPRDLYKDQFMEYIPGEAFYSNDKTNPFYNDQYDESYGISMVPLRSLYDNTAAFKKTQRGGLKALYDAVLQVMEESNEDYSFANPHDKYLLPQITGSFYKYLKNRRDPGHAALEWTQEQLGFREGRDTEIGQSIEHIFENFLDDGTVDSGAPSQFKNKVRGVMPDGRALNMVPKYYCRKMEHPEQISSDLIGIVCEYYKQAQRFKHKQEIKDQCESIVDLLEQRKYYTVNNKGQTTETPGSKSNTFNVARKFLDMNLYNIRQDRKTVDVLNKEVNITKLAQVYKNATVLINLGCNAAVAATGFGTSMFSHVINSMTGQKYDVEDAGKAGKEVFLHFLKNLGGAKYIGNKLSDDKLMLLAEMFDIAGQSERKYKHSNRNRLVNAVNENWAFGMLSGLDFLAKSNIMVSTLMSYHYVDGEFKTKEEINIYADYMKYSKSQRADEISKWDKGVSLYDCFEVKGNYLNIKSRYLLAYEKIEHQVYSRIQKYAEAADGMATETLKALATTSIIGSLILIHRQYFPLMLQNRFGNLVYDEDTGQYTQGIYRTVWDGLRLLLTDRSKLQDYFYDTSTLLASQLSYTRRKHIRQVASEVGTYFALIVPFASLMAALSSDKKNKDKYLLHFFAYVMRRIQWETFTPYRAGDIFNNIKTVSAATGTNDKLLSVLSSTANFIMPQSNLFETLLDIKQDKKDKNIVQKGVYEGWYKFYRDMFKLTPVHNYYEQYYGSLNKRRYYENEIMK